MLKPTCGFVYVFQAVSVTGEGACVELSAGLGDGAADGDGDCGLPVSELQDANRIAKMRKMDCFFIKTPLKVFWVSAAQRLASLSPRVFFPSGIAQHPAKGMPVRDTAGHPGRLVHISLAGLPT